MVHLATRKQIKAVLDAGWKFPPKAVSSVWPILNSISGSHAATVAMLNGTHWLGDELLGGPFKPDRAPDVLAKVATDPIFGGSLLRPFSRMQLGGGGVSRGSAVPAGAFPAFALAMVSNLTRQAPPATRVRMRTAIDRFRLSSTEPADLLAAHAYVWGMNTAPRVFWIVPYSGLQNEWVAEALMWHERANPGTLGLAISSHQAAQQIVKTVIAQVLAGAAPDRVVVEHRINTVDERLSTNSVDARNIIGIIGSRAQNQQWAAHHLIPFGVVRSLPERAQRAIANAGWAMDSAENLIALPANFPTYRGIFNNARYPIHDGFHPQYNRDVYQLLQPIMEIAHTMPPPGLRVRILSIEAAIKYGIENRRYHPILQ